VLGAAVGAGGAIYLARQDRAAQARADLTRAFSGYLAATETVVFEWRRRPWQPGAMRLWALNRGGVLSRYLFGKLYWIDRVSLRLMEGDRADRVRDEHLQAEANLRIVAPPRILDLLEEVDAMFRRWPREPPKLEDWLPLRQKRWTRTRIHARQPPRPTRRGRARAARTAAATSSACRSRGTGDSGGSRAASSRSSGG
jgi:hypothetical protein